MNIHDQFSMHSSTGLRPLVARYLFFILQYLFLDVRFVQTTYKEQVLSPHHQTGEHHYNEANSKFESFLDKFAYTASTDESKLRLALLVDDKIDRNKDGLVQLDELVGWLRICQDKYSDEDVNRQWVELGKSNNDSQSSIDWNEYEAKEYNNVLSLSDSLKHDTFKKSSHDQQMQKDLRRWKVADFNQDGRLTKSEFKSYVFPEQNKLMHKVLAQEKFESLDRNKDGRITFDEYATDLSNEAGPQKGRKRDEWLRSERSKFEKLWDTNHDNYIDFDELFVLLNETEWEDPSVAEAQNLMQSSDSDRDHRLSKEEILAAYHEFINSHVTDFGEALRNYEVPKHDEL